MINKILHPKQIEDATIRIKCGSKSGTAFIVQGNEQDVLVLTSNHTLQEEQPVTLTINQEDFEAEILDRIPEYDVALLRLKLTLPKPIDALPLHGLTISYNQVWETFGFPVQRVNTGGRYLGKVSRTNQGTAWDIDLDCDQYNNIDDFSGLSGAPLVIDGVVAGVIGYNLVGTLGASSLKNIVGVLSKHGVKISEAKIESIPDSIERDIFNTTPNQAVLEAINQVIAAQISFGYFLVTGNPGSGKTTIAAQLKFSNNDYVLCERFFVKVPESDAIPTQIRATPEFFMRWIEEVYFRILHDMSAPKSEKPLHERIANIQEGLSQLSLYYQAQKKIGFLFIDGLDDVNESKIEDFLSVLPHGLPPNIKVILFCTSKGILPKNFQALIDVKQEVKVVPLALEDCEKYLRDSLVDKNLTQAQITSLAQKSEGHPLYLRYLIKYVLGSPDLTSINDWINSIPIISGEIENYYNKIWLQLDDQIEEIWLAATLSRLRTPVDRDTLSKIVPDKTRHNFVVSFNRIQHLLRDENKISIYHTSFSNFVIRKTDTLHEQVNNNVSRFIEANSLTQFGISERIYHLTNGDNQSKRNGIRECSQAWVDLCALNSVNPDIVLADVKKVIGIAAEFGISHSVISLLLLSQRVNFRYNTLFQENATFLVNALLALGKPDEAIRYVVRNNAITTSDRDASYLLQRFFEYNANEEAETLLKAINQTCTNLADKGLDAETFNRFIRLKFDALTLASNSNFEDAFHEFEHVRKIVLRIIRESGNSEDTVFKFKDEVGSFNTGYFIWRFNTPSLTKTLEGKFSFDERSSGFIALSIMQALDFQEKSPLARAADNIPSWVEDLEYAIDKYGIHADYYFPLLYVLIGRSNRVDLIERLFKLRYPSDVPFSFREKNGVDMNQKAMNSYALREECRGFLDVTGKFPDLPNHGYSLDWEKSLQSHFTHLCFLDGKVKRLQVDGKVEKVPELQDEVSKLINSFVPDLKDRINWNRSYALPELIFPELFKRLIQILIDAFPSLITEFVSRITEKKNYQLGLYNEGYLDSLFRIMRKLAKTPTQTLHAFKVAKVVEEQVITTVENRQERNEYLLMLIELYGMLKSEDNAKRVFHEMINTSMGPSWYKEAQLGIINTAVSRSFPKQGNMLLLQKFAGHLHNASGEMTFQRYVKQQQEDFVGDLAKLGLVKKAIEYFKYLVFPDYKTIIENAELGLADMPYSGYGYVLGARAIDEQAGILTLLTNIGYKESLIVWGLAELQLVGDDRYMRGYAKIQARILNKIEKTNQTGKLERAFSRLSRFVVTEVSDEFRYEFLSELFEVLSDSNYEKIKPYLEAVGMSPSDSKKEKEQEKDHDEKPDPLNILLQAKSDALRQIELENKTGARRVVIDALTSIQNQKYGIWSSSYSNKINDVRELLSDTYSNSSELIKDITELIINEPYFEEWVVASELIDLLRNVKDDNEKQLILNAVLEHIEYMIRTPQSFHDKYDWLNDGVSEPDSDPDKLLLELLIWFLNHPSLVVKNRTVEILTWLGTIIPEVIIPALGDEIVRDGYQISRELCASIIHQISVINPKGFGIYLGITLTKHEKQLLSIEHFMIRDSIMEALYEAKNNGSEDDKNWFKKFESTFATSNKNKRKAEVIFEAEYLDPISHELDQLNEEGLLNGEFASNLLKLIPKIAPLSIDQCIKANRYIDRSFDNHNKVTLISDFDTLLRYALNVTIVPLTRLKESKRVANILRFYQPTFPENILMPSFNVNADSFENAVKELFETNIVDVSKFSISGQIPLGYYSRKTSHSRRDDVEIELIGYLTKRKKLANSARFPWDTFPANCLPGEIETREEKDGDIVLLLNYSDNSGSIIGSELVPPVINKKSGIVPDVIKKFSKTTYWRKGRNWDQTRQGQPQKHGYQTLLPLEQLNFLKQGYKLIWRINYGYNSKLIEVFENKEIEL